MFWALSEVLPGTVEGGGGCFFSPTASSAPTSWDYVSLEGGIKAYRWLLLSDARFHPGFLGLWGRLRTSAKSCGR